VARRRSGKKIDNLRWVGYNSGSSGFGLGAGTAGFTILNATTMPDTIMRTRGEIVGYVDAAQAPGTGALISVGMAVVPEGTSTTVLWSPFTDANAPWFYYE